MKSLNRSINENNIEKTLIGPKDGFIEDFDTNLGLIRKRIKNNLNIKYFYKGINTKTKIGIIYMDNMKDSEILKNIIKIIKDIDDDIIDINYLKKYLNISKIFPSVKTTERPDVVVQSLLNNRIILLSDNSPDIMILPTYFIDYFHSSDDYYQNNINTSIIRIIRLIAFIISIYLPSIYICITTYNLEQLPINILLNIQSQRINTILPITIECFIILIIFEILRETDLKIPSSLGTSMSILGGIVLGNTGIDTGLLSSFTILIISISTISSMLFPTIDMINTIRYLKIIVLILSSLLGIYGLFLGTIYILINLVSIYNYKTYYTYPITPINIKNLKNSFIRIQGK